MSTLFVSDVHLTNARANIVRAFIAFLETKARNADALFLFGPEAIDITFEGGDLVLADGNRFSGRREWFGYDGAQIEHWNTPITSGIKYAVVAHNTRNKPEAFPYKKKKHAASEGEPANEGTPEQEAD